MSWTIPQTHFLFHCEALWELQLQDEGDIAFSTRVSNNSNEGKSQFTVSLWVWLLWILVWTWTQEDILSLLVPKQFLCDTDVFQQFSKRGERNLVDYCHSNHSLNSSHILWLLNMLDVGASLGVFCQASCNRRKKLDGSQFIISTESTTDRFPLSPPLQHR